MPGMRVMGCGPAGCDACLASRARFADEGDDRAMVASRAQIEAEERRSARLGRGEDERAAAEEAAAAAAKAAKRKRRRAGVGGGALLLI